MCNEIEYAVIEEYITKLRQKELKEKESEKPIPEAVAQ